MPVITIDGPRVTDIGKKREFVKIVTSAASNLYGLPEQAIVVMIQEHSSENVGVGGQLLIDRPSPKHA